MLKTKHLTKHYGDFALDCSIEVKKGCITGLVGQNGSGKSTLFKAVLGLIRAEGGSVTVLGKDLKSFTPKDKENLGVVFSDSGFSGYLTVKDIVPVLKNLYKNFDGRFFDEQIKKFGLPYDNKIKEFSTGMKAKLKIIIAVSHKAKLLILDEPTSGLDVVARDDILMLLRDFMEQDEERAILISSHISNDLESLCDDIYMIHNGKIIMHEDTDSMLSDYAVLKVDEEQFKKLDKQYIIRIKKESYGYNCLTNQKQFYKENYPSAVIENGTIDNIITMMIKGQKQ